MISLKTCAENEYKNAADKTVFVIDITDELILPEYAQRIKYLINEKLAGRPIALIWRLNFTNETNSFLLEDYFESIKNTHVSIFCTACPEKIRRDFVKFSDLYVTLDNNTSKDFLHNLPANTNLLFTPESIPSRQSLEILSELNENMNINVYLDSHIKKYCLQLEPSFLAVQKVMEYFYARFVQLQGIKNIRKGNFLRVMNISLTPDMDERILFIQVTSLNTNYICDYLNLLFNNSIFTKNNAVGKKYFLELLTLLDYQLMYIACLYAAHAGIEVKKMVGSDSSLDGLFNLLLANSKKQASQATIIPHLDHFIKTVVNHLFFFLQEQPRGVSLSINDFRLREPSIIELYKLNIESNGLNTESNGLNTESNGLNTELNKLTKTSVSILSSVNTKIYFLANVMSTFLSQREQHFLPQTNPTFKKVEQKLFLDSVAVLKSPTEKEKIYGVFTPIFLSVNKELGEYLGEKILKKDIDKSENPLYTFELNQSKFAIDAHSKRGWTAFVNSASNESNANIDVVQKDGKIIYKTKRAIAAGEQLLIYYGDKYEFETEEFRFLNPQNNSDDSIDIYNKNQSQYESISCSLPERLLMLLKISPEAQFFMPLEQASDKLPLLETISTNPLEFKCQNMQENMTQLMYWGYMGEKEKIQKMHAAKVPFSIQTSIHGYHIGHFIIASEFLNINEKKDLLSLILSDDLILLPAIDAQNILFFAIEQEQEQLLCFLINKYTQKKEALFNKKNDFERTIFSHALSLGNIKIITCLLKHYPEIMRTTLAREKRAIIAEIFAEYAKVHGEEIISFLEKLKNILKQKDIKLPGLQDAVDQYAPKENKSSFFNKRQISESDDESQAKRSKRESIPSFKLR